MDDEVDPSVIKATQISLGKYVKRPPLTEKLLRKPPFRFLHDIVTSVLKSKGFFNGLFDENELISDNVKDRESKILFLNKVISVLSLTTGQPLSAKPSKIVAGQESVKTNELLQCLAEALDKNLSSDEAVKQINAGVKESASTEKKSDKKIKDNVKSVKKNSDPKKLASKSTEKLVTSDKDGKNRPKNKESAQSNKKESPPKKILPKVSYKKVPGKSDQENLPHKSDSASEKYTTPFSKQPILENHTADDSEKKLLDHKNLDIQSDNNKKNRELETNLRENPTFVEKNVNKAEISENVENNVKSTTAEIFIPIDHQPDEVITETNQEANVNKHILINKNILEVKQNFEENKKTIHDSENVSASADSRLDSEETSALLITNDKKYKIDAVIRPVSVRPSSSRPGAPRHREKNDIIDSETVIVGKVNIICENALQEEEEDIIIIDSQTVKDRDEIKDNQDHNNLINNQNSHLVQQILDSHKEYSQTSGKTEIEWQISSQKTPDVFVQEMEQLRFSVQALSRIANPLGKLLDHIQEDVEVMRQELHQWTKIYEEASKDLQKQKSINEDSLLPYHAKLKQLNMDIKEKREKITDLKVSNHKNALKIETLLANGNVQ